MTDQPSNDQFHSESFLQGHNAAYIEQLYIGHCPTSGGRTAPSRGGG
ncbi:MAG: hypothetical protein GY947_16500, partial [Rhodobacteraceae bacterium]|nr:hypothetical protein [Paracoccaceae bacterium]